MSTKRFIETLQALLTMVDPSSRTSVACVKSTLESIFALAMDSQKADSITLRIMDAAIRRADFLIHNRKDFAGVKGDYYGNKAKQQRLQLLLQPGC